MESSWLCTSKVSKSSLEANASSYLQTGWMKIYNIPFSTRTEEAMKQIAELAGEVVVIDELSLIRDGPVRTYVSDLRLSPTWILRICVRILRKFVFGHSVSWTQSLQLYSQNQPMLLGTCLLCTFSKCFPVLCIVLIALLCIMSSYASYHCTAALTFALHYSAFHMHSCRLHSWRHGIPDRGWAKRGPAGAI